MDRRTKSHAKTERRKEGESEPQKAQNAQIKGRMRVRRGWATERDWPQKSAKKEQDKKLVKWAEIRCEPWADNSRDYLEFDP